MHPQSVVDILPDLPSLTRLDIGGCIPYQYAPPEPSVLHPSSGYTLEVVGITRAACPSLPGRLSARRRKTRESEDSDDLSLSNQHQTSSSPSKSSMAALISEVRKWASREDTPYERKARPLVVLPDLPTPPFSISHINQSDWVPDELQVRILQGHIEDLESHFESLKSLTGLVIHRYEDLTKSVEAYRYLTVHDPPQHPRTRVAPLVELPDLPTLSPLVYSILYLGLTFEKPDLRALNEYIDQLESQLASLKSLTRLVTRRLGDLSTSITEHKGSISALRRLPTELLAHIFLLLVENSACPDIDIPYESVPRQAPWLLTRVCRRWSEVALGFKLLWCRVSCPLACQMPAHGAAPLMRLLHKRSGGVPLMIKIRDSEGYRHDGLDVVLEHAGRWKTLTIEVSTSRALGKLAGIRGRVHNLTELDICTHTLESLGTPLQDVRNAFSDGAAELTTIPAVFYHTNGVCGSSPFAFPWRQLTRLTTTFASSEEVPPILNHLSNIVELHVICAAPGTFPTDDVHPPLRALDANNAVGPMPPLPARLHGRTRPRAAPDSRCSGRKCRSASHRALRVYSAMALFPNKISHPKTIISIAQALPCLEVFDL
ncbi:hypothetical protein FB45DRAFT_859542 [Roridomyces roridus]|uniref:F-box domain-containing protein n=1 Tax=Roridomyces roridus TaxID=1738132 RepID=A0AAD7FZ73_9AGAR|nr:hypothetical protein FB45DRAFT_859542 [Roridomyces roridus]